MRAQGFDGSKLELVQRALTQSDFRYLLQNVMHKTLLAGYTAIPDVWRTFCAVGNINDFRPHYRYKAGSFGNLAEVKEDGTFTHGVLSDGSRESITGKTKGKLLSISRQAIINDDLGALTSAAREIDPRCRARSRSMCSRCWPATRRWVTAWRCSMPA